MIQVPEEANSPASFASLKFSPDGKILAGVVGSKIYQLDAYNGEVKQRHSSGIHEGVRPLEVCFSPDNNYLLSGADSVLTPLSPVPLDASLPSMPWSISSN